MEENKPLFDEKLHWYKDAVIYELHIKAFRDGNGVLHERSAVCPHLGCVVRWNSVERSWDCPCHGSHFAVDGEALNAPATAPLKGA